jgi:hypothetical protein
VLSILSQVAGGHGLTDIIVESLINRAPELISRNYPIRSYLL